MDITKLQIFADLVYKETAGKYRKFFTNGTPEQKEVLINNSSQITIKSGKKYTKVDVGGSGKYMVVIATGEIFGIKAYGVIHRGKRYGTLDTINDYFWGEYAPILKPIGLEVTK